MLDSVSISKSLICKVFDIYDILFCEINQLWILGSVDSHWINDFNQKMKFESNF